MSFAFHHLDDLTRKLMIDEVEIDNGKKSLYISKRFNQNGKNLYSTLLIKHCKEGNEKTLAYDLRSYSCFKIQEERNNRGKITLVKVPMNAADTFAEGEFNRFYIRGLCVRASNENKQLVVYRARYSESPRVESEYLIGSLVNSDKVLKDLRENIGVDTAFGLPMGPNSGLSVRFYENGFALHQ